MRLLFLFIVSFAASLSETALAAACCGGGISAPSLIAGDYKAQFSASYAFTEVVVDSVDARGVWSRWDEHQVVESVRLEAVHLLSDRSQAGVSLPLVRRSQRGEVYEGLGDISLSLGYEYLPDWDYNPYRPKGIGYLQLSLPTGRGRAESERGGLDSRGNGLWALGVGTLLLKTFGRWDVFTNFEIHRSLKKSVKNSQVNGQLDPGFGGSLGVGGGYNLKDWRWGAGVTWVYEDPIAIKGDTTKGETSFRGATERYATTLASISYVAFADWMATVTYTDQTLMGQPVNTSLGRGVTLQLQRHWSR